MLANIKRTVTSLSTVKLNLFTSIIFLMAIITSSPVLSLIFLIGWELLLINLFFQNKQKKKSIFAYTFLVVFIGIFIIKIWFIVDWLTL